MDLTALLETLLVLFTILFIGTWTAKLGWFTPHFASDLSHFVLQVTTPCMLLLAGFTAPMPRDPALLGRVFFYGGLVYVLLPLMGWAVAKMLRVSRMRQPLYVYMTTFTNSAYMGYPVILSLFGESYRIYVALMVSLFSILNYTLGVVLMARTKEALAPQNLLRSPGFLASILMVVFYLTGWQAPTVVERVVNDLAQLTTPLAMLVIGINLSTISVTKMLKNIAMWIFLFLKMLLLPVLFFFLFRMLVSDLALFRVLVVVVAMPIASACALFASRYEYEVDVATEGVFLSTLLCPLTVPLICLLLI